MQKRPIILIIGTRPEGIKLAPVYFALKELGLPVKLCATFQHTDLLSTVLELFGITPDYTFQTMQTGQDLFHITQTVLENCKTIFTQENPQLVVVQGDTSTAMGAALAAFYLQIPIAHIEAGLRTGNLAAPFPEEYNRQQIGNLAKYHFTPTYTASQNLQQAGINPTAIHQVGNTVIDALNFILEQTKLHKLTISQSTQELITDVKAGYLKIVLLTMHRRESFGEKMIRTLQAMRRFAQQHPEVAIIYPRHPNPQVAHAIQAAKLSLCSNILVVPALPYHELVYLLNQVDCIASDSGGIQEEATSLGKPVIILRSETDRPEAMMAQMAWLVGSDPVQIQLQLEYALHQKFTPTLLYGDGTAAKQIATILKRELSMIKVSVIGLGYIGLPTAIILAESGCLVNGYDTDANKVQLILEGVTVIEEAELGERLAGVLNKQTFHANTKLETAQYYIIAVPTPIKEDKSSDLSFVWDATKVIASKLEVGQCVIVESTVPVGTTKLIANYLSHATGLQAGIDFMVAFSPERVIPGQTFYELIHNNRLVGGINQTSTDFAKQLYQKFVKSDISTTSADAAEMVKLVENSCRDVQIAFANQVNSMAQAAGLDGQEIINLANQHPRIKILNPGCGVGGHCIAVDPWFLIESFPEHSQLLLAARQVNDAKPEQVLAQIAERISQIQINNRQIRVCVLGVTYKPDVDDLRNSPGFYIAQELQKWPHVELTVVEPYVEPSLLQKHFSKISTQTSDTILQSDLTIILVAHTQFKKIFKDLFTTKDVLSFCELKINQVQLAPSVNPELTHLRP